jgi:hypothetical protein
LSCAKQLKDGNKITVDQRQNQTTIITVRIGTPTEEQLHVVGGPAHD